MSIINELANKANHSSTIKETFPEIQHIKDDVVSLAQNVRNISNDSANAATNYMSNRMDDLKASSKVALNKMETRIKSKPSQSIAIAFVAGLATSYLLGRRS